MDSDTVTAVGDLGTILRTTDGGATWTPQTSGTTGPLYGVSFVDANTGTGGRLLFFGRDNSPDDGWRCHLDAADEWDDRASL